MTKRNYTCIQTENDQFEKKKNEFYSFTSESFIWNRVQNFSSQLLENLLDILSFIQILLISYITIGCVLIGSFDLGVECGKAYILFVCKFLKSNRSKLLFICSNIILKKVFYQHKRKAFTQCCSYQNWMLLTNQSYLLPNIVISKY